jgi:putative transcriptional regulator
MHYYSMTDEAICIEIGKRIKKQRLRKNITQQQLADATTISLKAIRALEAGKAKLTTLIAVLRHLGQLDTLDAFIPEMPISPIQLAEMQAKERLRASGQRDHDAVIKRTEKRLNKK